MSKTNVVWFRKGLRLHDNHPLALAQKDAKTIVPVFCLDPWFIESGNCGVNRINFLLESLSDLDSSLKKAGSRLVVLYGKPQEHVPAVCEALGADGLYFERDTEPYALERDQQVSEAVKQLKAEVHAPVGHTLFDPDAVIKACKGKAPRSMKGVQELPKRLGVPEPLDAPTTLPEVTQDTMKKLQAQLHGDDGAVPSLQALNLQLEGEGSPFKGGETEGLKRLEKHLAMEQWVCEFEKPKGNPALFDPAPATTVLSPYMKFGCVSSRLFWHRLKEIQSRRGGTTKPPVSLDGQLLWREFFYSAGYDTTNFDKMEGNGEVRQIPWDDNPEWVERWASAQTGFPWIDAIMTQLRTWGWMHHLARHSVACFLTRGDLFCHWERGRDVFDRLLVDGDFFINNGNWQWLSCSNFFYQYYRVYSPVTFGQKYDKSGAYIRHFLPVLKDMPDKYIYEPWKAPKEVQEKAKCVIGKDYPEPIVDHKAASQQCKDRMQKAYDENKKRKRS